MKLLTRRKWLIGIVTLFLILLLRYLFAPAIEYASGRWQLWQFTETCPRDQLRIESFTESKLEYYFTEADYATVTIDLSTGEITDGGHRSIPSDGFNSFFPLLRFQAPFFADNKTRLIEINRVLSTLAAPTKSKNVSYRYQVHLAFWRDDHLCVYHYAREDRPKLHGLALILGTNYWFHGH